MSNGRPPRKWSDEVVKRLIALAVRGDTWRSIAEEFGLANEEATSAAFQRYATEEEAQQRSAKVGSNGNNHRTGWVEPRVLRAPKTEPFAGDAFADNVRARSFGRPMMASDPRFSLTPSSGDL